MTTTRAGLTCTRCGGSVFRARDEYGVYDRCLQCGRHVDEKPRVLAWTGKRPRPGRKR